MNGDYTRIYQHPVDYLSAEIVNAYCFTKPYNRTQQLLQSKMFWNNIRVPKLYATTSLYHASRRR